MNPPLRDAKPSVALYWDFENLHASLSEARLGEGSYGKPDGRFRTQEPLIEVQAIVELAASCLLYTSPSPRDRTRSRMPSSA